MNNRKDATSIGYYTFLSSVVCPNCGSKRIELFSEGTPTQFWIEGICVDCDHKWNINSGD